MRWNDVKRQLRGVHDHQWHRVFAWRPVHCIDGTWVWLEEVDRCKFMSNLVPARVPFTMLGLWSFRSLPRANPTKEEHVG
ncbi:MAG: hypothetical protein JWL86_798 [Rhizobium sp.]|nr:hypothetical protein [Rhizobium sp.]